MSQKIKRTSVWAKKFVERTILKHDDRSAAKNFPRLYGKEMFITVPTVARHLSTLVHKPCQIEQPMV